MLIQPLDKEALRRSFDSAKPFRFVCIDNFLDPEFAFQVARSFPSFSEADQMGKGFEAVNESRKVQVTDYAKFPVPTKRLADALRQPGFLEMLAYMSGIENLVWDEDLSGGGMHETAASGLLDVHVDFNRLEDKQLHRRLNLLLYLNPVWDDAWGGQLELWDADVKHRHHLLSPINNRCVVFETSDVSFHGVRAVQCPRGMVRKSFAVYYYTREAPPHWTGKEHGTVFRARPEEHWKRYVRMPAETVQRRLQWGVARAKHRIARLTGGLA